MLHKTDYGLVYNDDGSLCVTHQEDGAVAVEEGTTNLCPNPSFETNTAGWTNQFGSGGFGRDTSQSYHGTASAKCIRMSSGMRGRAYFTVPLKAGECLTLSGYALAFESESVYVSVEYHGGDYIWKIFDGEKHSGSGQWERLTATGEFATSDCTAYCFIYNESQTTAAYWDAIQVEKLPFATSFVDGTRPDGILAYPIALKDDYTIACYRKSHTDEDYRHVVKLSDGTVFVDGVEDSEYDVGWIAGRNLLFDSDKEYSTASSILYADILRDTPVSLVEGETYTLSFETKADSPTVSNRIFLNSSLTVYGTFNFSTEWTRFSVTFVYNGGNYQDRQIFPHLYPSGSGTKYVRRFKLEKGSTATDWTPAPEDLGYDGDMLMLSNHTGHIKDLKILPYIATDKEIKQMYSGGTFDVTNKGIVIADNYSEVGPMNGIIAWWPLDGHTDDYSGNNNHATNNGATITSGIRGRAYEFDGSSYIRASNPLVQSAPFSISFWTKISSTSTQCLGCTRTEVGNGMSIFVINNKLRFDTDHQWTTGYTVPQNEWIHVVLMQDTSGKKLYIDGELEDSTSSVGSMSNLSSIFQIGASHSNGSSLGNYLNGVVSDYRIYNRALSPEEVKILYNATKPDPVPMQISNNGIVYLAGELKEV